MQYVEMTDAQLLCAYMHGWTARSYIGHGMSDRAQASRGKLCKELARRGIDTTSLVVQWGRCECDVPRHAHATHGYHRPLHA